MGRGPMSNIEGLVKEEGPIRPNPLSHESSWGVSFGLTALAKEIFAQNDLPGMRLKNHNTWWYAPIWARSPR